MTSPEDVTVLRRVVHEFCVKSMRNVVGALVFRLFYTGSTSSFRPTSCSNSTLVSASFPFTIRSTCCPHRSSACFISGSLSQRLYTAVMWRCGHEWFRILAIVTSSTPSLLKLVAQVRRKSWGRKWNPVLC